MKFEIEQVELAEAREPMVDFLWEQKHWPWNSREEYARAWDWRYSSLSDGPAMLWLARQGGEVVGHIAVYFRRYRMGSHELRVAVPGNLLVREDLRDTMIGPRLVNLPRTLVRKGEADLVLAYGNAAAHAMFLRLGFRELGAMRHYTDLLRAGPALGRRLRPAAAAGPLVDLALSVRRRWHGRGRPTGNALQVRTLSVDEILALDVGHWRRDPDAFVADDRPEYLARRFVQCPHAPRDLFALTDRESGRVEGYIVTEGERRIKVWDCQVNPDVLDESAAVSRVMKSIPGAETALVPLLPDSAVAGRFLAAGYLDRRAEDFVEAHTWWSAFWQPNHPLAADLEDTTRWKLWFGANHY